MSAADSSGTPDAPRLRRLFRALAELAVRRPRSVVAAGLALGALALMAAALRLETRTSNLDLVDPALPPVADFRAFAEEFGSPNMLVVVLEGEREDTLRQAADRLGEQLRQAPGVAAVFHRLPLPPSAGLLTGIDPYFFSHDRRLCFVFVQPDDPYSNAATLAPFVGGVRRLVAAERLEKWGITAGLTGTPAYALDDRDIIQRDLTRLTGLSLLAVFALFAAAFGALRRPLLATAAMLLAVALTFGVAVLWPGHLTLLSAFFASILFGQGIDGGIHLIGRVEELVAGGRSERQAVPEAVAALAPGLLTSTLTTAGAMASLMVCGFRGFGELGFLAAVSLLLCLLSMVTILPALLVLAGSSRTALHGPRRPNLGGLLFRLQGKASFWVLLAFGLVAFAAGGPGYDADYLSLQPGGSQTVRLERQMVERSRYSPQFAVFRAGSRQEAVDLVSRLRADAEVSEVRSALDLEPLAALSGKSVIQLQEGMPAMVSARGGWAVFAYPRGNVWEPEPQRAFVDAMRAVDPRVTGLPILGDFMIRRSLRAFRIAAALGGLLVLILLFLDFRDWRWTLMAAAPTALTALSLPFLMRLCGLDWNPLDMMALPIVLGVSVDEGVHLVHRYREERGDLRRTLAGAGRSVVFTSLTTIAGFGFLIFTEHRGLASFAAAVTLGVVAALVYSLFLLPPLLDRVGPRLLEGGGAGSGGGR